MSDEADDTECFQQKIHLQKKYFDHIQNGRKTVEGRLATTKYKLIRPGQRVQFVNDYKEVITVKIIHSNWYKNFRDMLLAEGVQNCIPDTKDLEKACEIYRSFPGYQEKEAEYGVLAFKLEILQ